MFRVKGLDRLNIEDYIEGVAVGAITWDTRSLDSSLYGRCSKILASFWNAMMLGHSDSQYTYLGHNEKRRNDLVGVGLFSVVLLRYVGLISYKKLKPQMKSIRLAFRLRRSSKDALLDNKL